jgi:hypothetical protein
MSRASEPSNESYRRLKPAIDANHPHGWYVAIADNHIVASAADFRELESILRRDGRDVRATLVVQAGIDYPEYVTIFA